MSLARKGMSSFGVALLCGGLLCSGPASAQTVEHAVEDAFWDSVKGCTSAGEVEAYLKEFPKGRYVGAARACLARLRDPVRPPGTAFRDCPECPEMVVVPAGSFTMGSPPGEKGRDSNEGPQRTVTIRKPFAVGRYEVTRGEFARFVATTGYSTGNSCYTYNDDGWNYRSGFGWRNPGYGQTDRDPVTCVNWRDAKAYVSWLSHRTGKRFRLLSEAEWEYAARAGTTTSHYWGNSASVQCNYANAADAAAKKRFGYWTSAQSCNDGAVNTAPVGRYRANRFGLHDMAGNVWEIVEDCWHKDYRGAPSDGRAWTAGGNCVKRVLRGGSWSDGPRDLRAAFRYRYSAGDRIDYNGFRVARTLSP